MSCRSEQFLCDLVNPSNVLDLFPLAEKLEYDNLRKLCIECAVQNCELVFKSSKLLGLTSAELQAIVIEMNIERDNFRLRELMCESASAWADHDPVNRAAQLSTILKSILQPAQQARATPTSLPVQPRVQPQNLPFPSSFPTSGHFPSFPSPSSPFPVSLSSSFSSFQRVHSLNDQSLNKSVSQNSLSSTTTYQEYKSSRIYCFGGRNENFNFLSSVSCFDTTSGSWNCVSRMSVFRANFDGAVINSKIYLFGGMTNDDQRLDLSEVFDCRNNSWTPLRSMPEGRSHFATAALGGYIYLTGGKDSHYKELSSVFRYCVATDQWSSVAPMKEARYGHQLVESNGRLYAIAGNNSTTVEEYNPALDQWASVPGVKFKHCSFGVTEHAGKVYICSHEGFEVYSPDSNTWQVLPALASKSWGRTLVSMGGKLIALGGGKEKEVWEFDAGEGKWTKIGDMDVARRDHCSFVVNG